MSLEGTLLKKLKKLIPYCVLIALYLVLSSQIYNLAPENTVLAVVMYIPVCLSALGIAVLLIICGIRVYKASERFGKLVWYILYALVPILCLVLDSAQYLRHFNIIG